MTNIRKIAKLTGYSVSSVSRVINNHPHVSEEARQKILQVMEELDYRPNILAQELSSGSTRRGRCSYSQHDPAPLFQSVTERALGCGYGS